MLDTKGKRADGFFIFFTASLEADREKEKIMSGKVDTDTNQTSKTLNTNTPDQSDGIENPPRRGGTEENVPPVEVPGRSETPEHVPEKSGLKKAKI